MPSSPLSRIAAGLLAGCCLVALAITFGAGQEAAAQSPICEQDVSAATDGRFMLDRSVVSPGDDILGVLTDFQQWPAALIGGGSGETFLSCTPWAPDGSAEVIPSQGAPFLLLAVPADVAPGPYTVSVVFQEGSTQPTQTDGHTARLTAQVTVAAHAPLSGGGTSPACGFSPPPASVGQLAATASVRPGRPLAVTLTGVPPVQLSPMNEYDRLWFVACLDGVATPIAHLDEAPTAFTVDTPTGLAPGGHPLRVLGRLDNQDASWVVSVNVAATSGLPPSGTDAFATTMAGILAIVLGGLALLAARRSVGRSE